MGARTESQNWRCTSSARFRASSALIATGGPGGGGGEGGSGGGGGLGEGGGRGGGAGAARRLV